MPAKVIAIQFFSLLFLLFFLSLFYFHPMVPAINIFYKYQLYQLLSRKRATPSQDGSRYLFGRHHIHSRAHTPPPPIKNPQSKRLLSLVTSSSVTSRVKEFWAPVAGDPPSIFVLPKSTDSAILGISKSFKNRIHCSNELVRYFEIFPDRRKEVMRLGLLQERRKDEILSALAWASKPI